MPGARHHTVSAFLLDRFARDTKAGRRICMLEKASGKNTLASPRDAGVRKHFYSIDLDERRDPAVEVALSQVESVAAPLIEGLARGQYPVGQDKLNLATFVGMCWLRTPVWRAEMASVMEQATAEMVATSYRLDPGAAQRALEGSGFEMTEEEIEEFRRTFVEGLETGRIVVEMPKNAMIGHFLRGAEGVSWILFILDWTLVEVEGDAEFIIGDTPVSLHDPAPRLPGGGVGVLSSPDVEIFLPLGPRLGLGVGAQWQPRTLSRNVARGASGSR
jgi:Protein of unknown function (DUF4238)